MATIVNTQHVSPLYPEIAPYESGYLSVSGGNHVYWEMCGNPIGKPVVVLHGGPGSGCTPRQRRLFDPERYRNVLFDQRNCGRSTPHASLIDTRLTSNTTPELLADMEQIRQHFGIEKWLVFGGSWGSTLGLAYAEAYPERVTEMILLGITTGRHSEVDWLFRGGVSQFFPAQWERLRSSLLGLTPQPEFSDRSEMRDAEILTAYYHHLNSDNLALRQQAANAWCLWESATMDWPPTTTLAKRYTDPAFALAFARIVTHYMQHNLWLEDGILLCRIDRIATIPSILINGRFDFQSPIRNAWELHRLWHQSKLVIVDDAGHAATDESLIAATNAFVEMR